MARARYQNGCLTKEMRAKGAVWVFRFREPQADGAIRHRKLIVGTVDEYQTESAAQAAVVTLRVAINNQSGSVLGAVMSVGQLVDHYWEKEFGPTASLPKAFPTRESYNSYLKNWIIPRWKSYRLPAVKAVGVEEWLAKLPLAPGSRAKIRNIMHALVAHAERYEWIGKNPISCVRQSAKRVRVPVVLDAAEISRLLTELDQLERVLVLVDAALGIRRGELLGLKWLDIDFDKLEVDVCRSIYRQGRILQDGSFAETATARSNDRRRAVALEAGYRLQSVRRLGVRKSADARKAAVLARGALAAPHPAGGRARRHHQADRLAHVSA